MVSVFVVDHDLHIVLAIIDETATGWNGFALLKGKPAPIGARLTRDGAIRKALALVDAAGLKVKSYAIQTVDATVTVSPARKR